MGLAFAAGDFEAVDRRHQPERSDPAAGSVSDLLVSRAVDLVEKAVLPAGRQEAPFWTIGGGSAIALRHRHRRIERIEVFLGLEESFEALSRHVREHGCDAGDIEVSSERLSLLYVEGEIEFAAGLLHTLPGYVETEVASRRVRLETDVEAMAKIALRRFDRPCAADLLDLAQLIASGCDLHPIEHEIAVRKEPFCRKVRAANPVMQVQFERLRLSGSGQDFLECSRAVMTYLDGLRDPSDYPKNPGD